MPRTILVEKPQNIVTKSVEAKDDFIQKEAKPDQVTDGVIISADDMEKLLHEWNVNGKNDLLVDSTLADRIRQYIKYQEELDPLKKDMAKRVYSPFKVYEDSNISLSFEVHLNEIFIAEIPIYKANGLYRLININDFKFILIALHNPFAPWINEEGQMDLMSYMISIGYSYEITINPQSLNLNTNA